jgi:hypothetical protein
MKSLISIFLATVIVALCFVGCSNIPDEPATTTVANYSYVNPMGQIAPPPANVETTEGQTFIPQYVETVNNVELVFSSYHVYGNTVASIVNVDLEDDGFSLKADGYVDVRVDAIGSRSDNMKIGFIGYDAEGTVVRDSYLLVPLKGVKEGDIVEDRRIDFPRECVKIVFTDWVEAE